MAKEIERDDENKAESIARLANNYKTKLMLIRNLIKEGHKMPPDYHLNRNSKKDFMDRNKHFFIEEAKQAKYELEWAIKEYNFGEVESFWDSIMKEYKK